MDLIAKNAHSLEIGIKNKMPVFVLPLEQFGIQQIRHVIALQAYMDLNVLLAPTQENGIKLQIFVYVLHQ